MLSDAAEARGLRPVRPRRRRPEHARRPAAPGAEGFGGFAEAFGDIFGDIFGGARRAAAARGGQQVYRGSDLSLRDGDHARGSGATARKRRSASRAGTSCETCHGSGAKPGTSAKTCTTCHGAGAVQMRQGFFSIQQTCPHCHGSGKIIPEPCTTCHGQGKIKKQQDAGGEDPGRHQRRHAHPLGRQRRAGHQRRPAGRPLHRDPHQEARDLRARRRRPALHGAGRHRPRAALGGDDRGADARRQGRDRHCPKARSTARPFRLRGKGIKGVRSSYPGDLYCHVAVETPVKLTEHQRKLLKELDESLQARAATATRRTRRAGPTG